jgi:hypothetical protein
MQEYLITVVLRDTLPKRKRMLAESGKVDHVHEIRIDPDLAVETLILKPRVTEERP